MKKLLLLIALLSTAISYSQKQGPLFQATLKQGSAANTVKVMLKPSASFSGQFSNVQFTFQLPAALIPQPAVTIKTNPLSAFIPTANYKTMVSKEGNFYNYLFTAVLLSSPTYKFEAAVEIEALEVEVNGVKGKELPIRLASLPNGGTSGQMNFYIEVNGNDNTNEAAMFYGAETVNGGSYAKYSFSALTKTFSAEKKFKLVPNPAKTQLTLIAPYDFSCESCELKITDAKGTLVVRKEETFIQSGNKEIVLTGLAEGMYFLSVESKGKIVFRERFVKL